VLCLPLFSVFFSGFCSSSYLWFCSVFSSRFSLSFSSVSPSNLTAFLPLCAGFFLLYSFNDFRFNSPAKSPLVSVQFLLVLPLSFPCSSPQFSSLFFPSVFSRFSLFSSPPRRWVSYPFYKARDLQQPSPPRPGSWHKTWSRFGSDALWFSCWIGCPVEMDGMTNSIANGTVALFSIWSLHVLNSTIWISISNN
jgi:hypothetical protein